MSRPSRPGWEKADEEDRKAMWKGIRIGGSFLGMIAVLGYSYVVTRTDDSAASTAETEKWNPWESEEYLNRLPEGMADAMRRQNESDGSDESEEPEQPEETDESDGPATSDGSDESEPADQPEVAGLDWTGVQYEYLNGTLLPISPVHGPSDHGPEGAGGFSQDTGGAVLAAMHHSVRVAPQVGPDVFRPAIEQMVGDTEMMLTRTDADYQVARASHGLQDGEPLPPNDMVIGYDVPVPIDATDDVAEVGELTVHLLSRGAGQGGRQVTVSVAVTVSWVDDDWRLHVPPGGTWLGELVTNTDDYAILPR